MWKLDKRKKKWFINELTCEYVKKMFMASFSYGQFFESFHWHVKFSFQYVGKSLMNTYNSVIGMEIYIQILKNTDIHKNLFQREHRNGWYFDHTFTTLSRFSYQQVPATRWRSRASLPFSHPLFFSQWPDGMKRTRGQRAS